MFDLIALAILTIFAYLGWRRGTLLTALSGAGLFAGYLAAIFFYRPIGEAIGAGFNLPAIVGYSVGGLFALVTTNIVVSLIARQVRKGRARLKKDGLHPTVVDRTGGAAIGAVWGGAIVVLIAWGGAVLQGLTDGRLGLGDSVSGRLSAGVIERVVHEVSRRATGDDFLASVVAFAAVDPQKGAEAINRLVSDNRLQALFRDGALRDAIVNSDVASVAQNPLIQSLLSDESFVKAASQLHLIDGFEAGGSVTEAAEQLTERIGPLVRTVERLSHDGEFQRILRESNIVQRFQQGDVVDLIRDPDFEELFGRLREALSSR